MESLLKQLKVLRIANYCNLLIAVAITIIQSLEDGELLLLSISIVAGSLIAALAINGVIIQIKREL